MSTDSFNDVLFWIGDVGITGIFATVAFIVVLGAALSAGLLAMIILPKPGITLGHRIMYGALCAPLAGSCGLLAFGLIRDFTQAAFA
jgi:hypothetical protein